MGIGESLFDVFPDRDVLGGAPLNFSVHAHDLLARSGGSATIISRVGRDELGDRLIKELNDRNVPDNWMQRDAEHPTGRSLVTLKPGGDAEYEIVNDVAWDFLELDDSLRKLAQAAKVVCFNTLGQRSAVSRSTIHNFADLSKGIRLFDINLRQTFYDRALIEAGFTAATHAKLNLDEIKLVDRLLELGANDDIENASKKLIARFDLQFVAVTRGTRGTILFTRDQTVDGNPVKYPHAPNSDTVGAGDACNAGLAVGLLFGRTLREIVALANDCGAYVASQSGATPRIPGNLLSAHALAR